MLGVYVSFTLTSSIVRELTREDTDTSTSNTSTKSECVICLDCASSHAFIPCGHVCVCAACACEDAALTVCPVCRAETTGTLRVYGV